MESFFGALKLELLRHERYVTRANAKQSIFEYIEVFYNRKRKNSTLGYVSPSSSRTWSPDGTNGVYVIRGEAQPVGSLSSDAAGVWSL